MPRIAAATVAAYNISPGLKRLVKIINGIIPRAVERYERRRCSGRNRGIEPNRTEPSRAEPSRAELNHVACGERAYVVARLLFARLAAGVIGILLEQPRLSRVLDYDLANAVYDSACNAQMHRACATRNRSINRVVANRRDQRPCSPQLRADRRALRSLRFMYRSIRYSPIRDFRRGSPPRAA